MNLNFAENFKRYRKEKGVTQEKVAEILGVSSQSVSRWELSICYPDLELLPSIANYFGVTVDTLLSNDVLSKKKDHQVFEQRINELWEDTGACIDITREYCRKYPDVDLYAYELICAIQRHVLKDGEQMKKYEALLLKNVERLMETRYRNTSIRIMITLSDEKEMGRWLDMTPYAGFSRRVCLLDRATARKDWEEDRIQGGLDMLESFAQRLDYRFPDRLGAERKAAYQQAVLNTVASFGEAGEIPDGWKLFYGYKELVLSACLFRLKKTEEAWMHFDSAIEKCKFAYAQDEEWLDIGGALFSHLKVSKDWNYALDEKGRTHKLFGIVNLSFRDPWNFSNLLTNPRWAWFDSVRDTEKFQSAVAWIRQVEKKQEE